MNFDFAVLDWMQSVLRCTFLDYLMAAFSYAAEAGAVWIVLGLVLLFFKKTRAAAMMLLIALLLGWVLGDLIIKPLVQRSRPFVVNPDVVPFIKKPSSFSFPSGHSCTSAVAATVLLVKHRKIGLAVLPFSLLVMLSRLYNYVHFPTDVLGGALLGVLSALFVMLVFRKTGLENKLSPKEQ